MHLGGGNDEVRLGVRRRKRNAAGNRGRRDHGADLGGGGRGAADEQAPQPFERRGRKPAERAAAQADSLPARRARAQVGLQRAALVKVERALGQSLNGGAIEPLAEDEQLGEPVARREQRLLDLRRGEIELLRRLRDAHAVELAEDVDAALALGQRRERRHESTGERLGVARRELGHLVRGELAPPHDEVDRRVVRDAEEPGPHLLGNTAVAQRSIRLEERRLRDVVACRRIAEEVRAVGRQSVHVPPVELVERSRLAGGEAAAEALVREPLEEQRAHVFGTAGGRPPDCPSRRRRRHRPRPVGRRSRCRCCCRCRRRSRRPPVHRRSRRALRA